MNKTTVEINRSSDHIPGYGFLHGWPKTGEQEVLDALLGWCQQPDNVGRKVYRHVVRTAEELTDLKRWVYSGNLGAKLGNAEKLFKDEPDTTLHLNHDGDFYTRHHPCDALTLLDIYWQ